MIKISKKKNKINVIILFLYIILLYSCILVLLVLVVLCISCVLVLVLLIFPIADVDTMAPSCGHASAQQKANLWRLRFEWHKS